MGREVKSIPKPSTEVEGYIARILYPIIHNIEVRFLGTQGNRSSKDELVVTRKDLKALGLATDESLNNLEG